MSAPIAIKANNNRVVNIGSIKPNLFKFKNYQKFVKNQRFQAIFLNFNVNNIHINLNFDGKFLIIAEALKIWH